MHKSSFVAATAITAGLFLAASGSSAWAAVPAKKHKLPKDVCALLTDDEVAVLVQSATSKPNDKTKFSVGCSWRDESANTSNLDSLTVTVSKLPVPLAEVKLSLKAEAKDAGVKPIKGLGNFAYQASVIPANSEVKALIGKLFLDVEFSGFQPVTDEQIANVLDIAKALAKKI